MVLKKIEFRISIDIHAPKLKVVLPKFKATIRRKYYWFRIENLGDNDYFIKIYDNLDNAMIYCFSVKIEPETTLKIKNGSTLNIKWPIVHFSNNPFILPEKEYE